MTEILTVKLGDRSYPIHFSGVEERLRSCIAELQKQNRICYCITDSLLHPTYESYLKRLGFTSEHIYVIPSGEQSKSIQTYSAILSFLASNSVNRDAALFAFGGGVVGDLVGFVAASYLRGIDFYQIPTSLLSMVDSSVGGKTGINLPEGKNLVGAFWQPKGVFIDTTLLNTLAKDQFASGMAEVIKYGLIADSQLFAQLTEKGSLHADDPDLSDIIRRSCEIKAEIVAKDEKETASSDGRALLNLGHTFGHAIENVSGYGDYLHGEAIAIGLHCAGLLSETLDFPFRSEDTVQIVECLHKQSLPSTLKAPLSIESLNRAITRDKKNRASGIRYIGMEALGKARTTDAVDPETIRHIWKSVGAAD